jgi:predicted dehydrogenase
MKFGILGPAEIAYRRFLPALKHVPNAEYIGVAVANIAERFVSNDITSRAPSGREFDFQKTFGGEIFESYEALVNDSRIETVYIPLIPILHYKWAKFAVEYGKHILLEKPFTTSLDHTLEILNIAKANQVTVFENYMYRYHSQLKFITDLMSSGSIGEVRLVRADFCYPFRGFDDFRYSKNLGGGALLDCGGYPVNLANFLLGETARVATSKLNYLKEYDVDVYGSATLQNREGLTTQISFGMDNKYKGSLEVVGSKGSLIADRIFTAPADFSPKLIVTQGNKTSDQSLPPDDSFKKSIEEFIATTQDPKLLGKHKNEIVNQAKAIEVIQSNNV